MKFSPDISFNYELREVQARVFYKKQRLDLHRPLHPTILNKLLEDLRIEWTYNSNNIEGNTLTLAETKLVLQEGITIGGKKLREHFEVINHHKAISYLEEIVSPGRMMETNDLLSLHEYILKNIIDDYAGRFRPGMVRIVGANFVPPNAQKVPSLLEDLISYINENTHGFDAVTLATLFHHRFVWIHPFIDGNGRTVRLAMNLILMSHGYPPAFILTQDRKKYFNALNDANNGDYDKLLLMMFQAVERTLNIYLSSIGGDYEDFEPMESIAREDEVPYSAEYLSLLARKGRIDAYKEGKVWLTTKSAIEAYRKNKLK